MCNTTMEKHYKARFYATTNNFREMALVADDSLVIFKKSKNMPVVGYFKIDELKEMLKEMEKDGK